MRFADAHKFWNGDPPEIVYAPDIIYPSCLSKQASRLPSAGSNAPTNVK
jgi:hypothetical protein